MQTSTSTGKRLIWDLPTRVFHWALAGSFLGAYLLAEEDGSRSLHVMFGYTVAGLLAFRLLWGFVGSTHARFRDFAYGPRAGGPPTCATSYRGRAQDYDGHNPAGSWAIYALLALAAATVADGLALLQWNRRRGARGTPRGTRQRLAGDGRGAPCRRDRRKPGPSEEPGGLDDHRSPTRWQRGRNGRCRQRADAESRATGDWPAMGSRFDARGGGARVLDLGCDDGWRIVARRRRRRRRAARARGPGGRRSSRAPRERGRGRRLKHARTPHRGRSPARRRAAGRPARQGLRRRVAA